jgi:hypothetical protein
VAFDVYNDNAYSSGPQVIDEGLSLSYPLSFIAQRSTKCDVLKGSAIKYHIWGNETNIYVSFRGTHTLDNIVTDLDMIQVVLDVEEFAQALDPSLIGRKCLVHRGFLWAYNSIRLFLKQDLENFVTNASPTVHITGHSLGGACTSPK